MLAVVTVVYRNLLFYNDVEKWFIYQQNAGGMWISWGVPEIGVHIPRTNMSAHRGHVKRVILKQVRQ